MHDRISERASDRIKRFIKIGTIQKASIVSPADMGSIN
jgi:hypothetical protein